MELPEYVYSLDGEWYDDFDTIQAEVDSEYEPGDTCCGYRGNPIEITHADQVRGMPPIVELLQEVAYEEDGDVAENYLQDMTDEKEEELKSLICDWLNKNCKEPGYYKVDNVEDFVFISED